jgi:hypothetical protein
MSTKEWPMVPLGDLLELVSRPEVVKPTERYDLLGAHWYAKGLYIKESKDGSPNTNGPTIVIWHSMPTGWIGWCARRGRHLMWTAARSS